MERGRDEEGRKEKQSNETGNKELNRIDEK